jgi:hypothetical protein
MKKEDSHARMGEKSRLLPLDAHGKCLGDILPGFELTPPELH